jgi:hypothetical protein
MVVKFTFITVCQKVLIVAAFADSTNVHRNFRRTCAKIFKLLIHRVYCRSGLNRRSTEHWSFIRDWFQSWHSTSIWKRWTEAQNVSINFNLLSQFSISLLRVIVRWCHSLEPCTDLNLFGLEGSVNQSLRVDLKFEVFYPALSIFVVGDEFDSESCISIIQGKRLELVARFTLGSP